MSFIAPPPDGFEATLTSEIQRFYNEFQNHQAGTAIRGLERAYQQLSFWAEAVANARIEGHDVEIDELARASVSRYGNVPQAIKAASNLGRASNYISSMYRPALPLAERASDPAFVSNLHHVAMSDGLLPADDLGRYRSHPAQVNDHRIGRPANRVALPEEIGPWMQQWSQAYDAKAWVSRHPVLRAAAAHASFEQIHPYRDGNGRVGRLLIDSMLAEDGMPALPISAAIERQHPAYHAALTDTIKTGDHAPFARFLFDRATQAIRDVRTGVRDLKTVMGDLETAMAKHTRLEDRDRRLVAIAFCGMPVSLPGILTRQSGVEVERVRAGLIGMERAGAIKQRHILGKSVYVNTKALDLLNRATQRQEPRGREGDCLAEPGA
ncbi:Fic family protein [Rhodovibrio sodomensis]|nr:Fic family protein [Rhodovibrio sodomensis]